MKRVKRMERTVDQDLSLPSSEMAVSCMMTRDWDRKNTHGFETINVKIVAKEVRHSFRLHETGLRPSVPDQKASYLMVEARHVILISSDVTSISIEWPG